MKKQQLDNKQKKGCFAWWIRYVFPNVILSALQQSKSYHLVEMWKQ